LEVVVQAYNPSTVEAEVGGSQIQGHPGLYSENLNLFLQKKKSQECAQCQNSYLIIREDLHSIPSMQK
jgi:hypothetical protein